MYALISIYQNTSSHYGLQEDIHVDDFITSYMLKTCLLKLLIKSGELWNAFSSKIYMYVYVYMYM